MKKILILCVTLTLVISLATLVIAANQGPSEVTFTPKMGTVTFNHAAHQAQTDCATCHHTGEFAQCKSCHGTVNEAPQIKDAFHSLCKNCHQELAKGPTKCKECHVK